MDGKRELIEKHAKQLADLVGLILENIGWATEYIEL